jgi:hypothetical protein
MRPGNDREARMGRSLAVSLVVLMGLSACAHSREPVATGPDLAPSDTAPAPANARLYADCIGQAIDTGSYARAHDPSTELLVFSCTGAPARAFYDALAERSRITGSEYSLDGRTLRTTEPIQRDRFGTDGCSWDGATDWRCDISLRTGTFLTDAH